MKTHWVQVVHDEAAAAVRAAHFIAGRLRRAVDAHGHFRLALGGAAHAVTLQTLAAMRLPFAAVEVIEAAAQRPPATNQTNPAALLAACGAQVRTMPIDAADLSAAANAYQHVLAPRLDFVHLAVDHDAPDVAGFLKDPLRALADRDVAFEELSHGRARMVLTWRGIAAASEVLWVATGAAGALHIARLVSAEPTSSLRRLMAGNVRILADRTAAEELQAHAVPGVSFWQRRADAAAASASFLNGTGAAPVHEEGT